MLAEAEINRGFCFLFRNHNIFLPHTTEVMMNGNYISILLILFFLISGRVDLWSNTWMTESYGVADGKVIHQDEWVEIYRWVEADEKMPDREEVLALIRYHFGNFDKLTKLVRYLDTGKPYAYLMQHIYPKIGHRKGMQKELPVAVPEVPAAQLPAGFIEPGTWTLVCPVAEEKKNTTTDGRVVLAVKNNLLYDLALAPNIEVEVPIGRRWSLNTEYKCPWWTDNSGSFCYQLLSGGVEARCWLGNRRERDRLTGHFVGVYAEGGVYDFQWKEETGYRGKYYGAAGLTYGYSHRIARRLAIEFSLGVGYLETEYRKYTSYKGDLVWISSGRYHFIGPTKAKVSLVWLIMAGR